MYIPTFPSNKGSAGVFTVGRKFAMHEIRSMDEFSLLVGTQNDFYHMLRRSLLRYEDRDLKKRTY